MPALPEWLLRLPDIRAQLDELQVPVVDRAMLERIFGLRRRRAIQLMHRFGGYQAGKTFLVERSRLLEQLDSLAHTPGFHEEYQRKHQLSRTLDDSLRSRAAHQIRIPVSPGARDRMVADLPPGIQLRAGRLTVEFVGVEDLLSKLYDLSRAAVNDFDRFSAAARQ